MIKSFKNILICSLFAFTTTGLNAAVALSNISPQQIEQFKRLPESQQRALAKSMGIDFNLLKSQLNQTSTSDGREENVQQPVYPRGTKFDEFGNPTAEVFTLEEYVNNSKEDPKPFGYDVFANSPSTFAPTLDIAVPESYIISSGDTLKVQLFGKENREFQILVSRDGNVVIPELGPFPVAGLTFSEVKLFLASKIKEKILGVDVFVNITELRSMRVFVLGEVYKPGPYILSSLSSITHAIFAAGGFSDIGSLRQVELKRAGKQIIKLDLYELLIKGDSSNDLLLQPGDVVIVPPVEKTVTISGEVRRSAIYELSGNETFSSIIEMAGGLLPSAFPASTVVERFNPQNLRTVKTVDLTADSVLNQQVKAGDYIRVLPTSNQYEKSVALIGAVTRPGKYQWKEGLSVRDIIPNIYSYLLDEADLQYSIVVRETGIERKVEIHQFSVAQVLANNNKQNIRLKPRDKIIIFSNKEEVDEFTLDSLAYTKSEIEKNERYLAIKNYQSRQFWSEFGEDADIEKNSNRDASEEALELASKSIDELMGAKVKEEIHVRELSVFSRKRLLTPIIQQLKRQAITGEPIRLIEVEGAVKYPGVYPLAVNGTVNSAIAAAGGLLESAYLERSEITRDELRLGSARKSSIDIKLGKALSGDVDENINLKSKDRLYIHTIPAWQDNHIVELRGEFMFPGKYTIRRGETLAQLINRAGGYTDYAYTEGSIFTREKLKQLEMQNLLKVAEGLRMEIASKSLAQSKSSQMVDYSQAKVLLADLTKVKPVGRLVVDLPDVKENSNNDVLLENGDVLYVPTKQNSVNVIGQVQVAASHLFKSGLSVEDYISLSGGIKQQADGDRIYIIKANGAVEIPSQGSNWFASNNVSHLEPGDTVVVPLDSDYMDNLTLWSTGTQIIYQAAVAIAAISGI